MRNFAYADSLTYRLWYEGSWFDLDSVGRQALRVGTDFPLLRMRLGYSALAQEQPAEAIRQYRRALAADPANDPCRYQLAAAYLGMNQREAARLVARPLPDSLRQQLRLLPVQAISGLEASFGTSFTTLDQRQEANFTRIGLNSQLGARLRLEQAVAYYKQFIQLPDDDPGGPGPGGPGPGRLLSIQQWEYQALLSGQLAPRWQAKLGYHYLNSDLGRRTYPSYLTYAALRYARPAWNVQTGLYAGRLTDTTRTQFDLRATAYPLGNLRLYVFGRGSLLRSGGRSYPNGLLGVGGRVLPRFWLDGFAGFGRVPVLAEADGAYVYNLLDPLRNRFGLSGSVFVSNQTSLHLHYVYERRYLTPSATLYTQHSITVGFAWNR